jgi:preprotein translocase subunit SecF
MALAALGAMIHDLLITAGVYSLVGFDVVPATVVATLTILGYSIYDTVVVFDKVQENTSLVAAASRQTYTSTMNLSLNETMMRSLNTSITSLIPVGALLLVGLFNPAAGTLKDFALALFVGLLCGTYSSLFFASPVLAMMKEAEPRYQAIRARLEQKGSAPAPAPKATASVGGRGASRRGPAADLLETERRADELADDATDADGADDDVTGAKASGQPGAAEKVSSRPGAGGESAGGGTKATPKPGTRPRPAGGRPAPKKRPGGGKRKR